MKSKTVLGDVFDEMMNEKIIIDWRGVANNRAVDIVALKATLNQLCNEVRAVAYAAEVVAGSMPKKLRPGMHAVADELLEAVNRAQP